MNEMFLPFPFFLKKRTPALKQCQYSEDCLEVFSFKHH